MSRGCVSALRNCRGDDDIDAKRSKPSIGKTRDKCHARKERVVLVGTRIRGLHQGQRPQRSHSKAVYMAAPDPLVEMSDFPLAPRAPMVWTPPSQPGRMSDLNCSDGRITMQVVRIGLDLAKYVFEVHGVDAHGNVVMRKTLRRGSVSTFFCQSAALLGGDGSF